MAAARKPEPVENGFLRLLANAPDSSQIEDFAAGLMEASDPAAVAGIESARTFALRVHNRLKRRERRDTQLTALFDTANDLASLQDLDAVLRSISQRARRLLDCDVAYLSLFNDDAAGTYVRVADGSVSGRLQNLRLSLGVGIGGVVARGAAPFATPNYFEDPALEHDNIVDQAVAEEGLVAILGVPLLVADEVIGVLFAADRRERAYTPDEAALLAALATHAALAIEKTRLLQNATSALSELNVATEVIREHGRSVERAAEAHERLTELVLRGGGVTDVAEAVVGILGGSLVVLDADDRVLATAGPQVTENVALVVTAASTDTLPGRSAHEGGWSVAPIVAGSDRLGTLLLRPDLPLHDTDRRLLDRAAMVTALLLVWRRSVVAAEIQYRGDVLRDILTNATPSATLHERARAVGVDLAAEWCVVVVRADAERRRLLAAAAAAVPRAIGLIGEQGQDVVLVLPAPSYETCRSAATSVTRNMATQLGTTVTAAVAGPAKGPNGVRTAYEEARRCVQALLALGREGQIADMQELGFLGVLLSGREDLGGYLRHTLGPVLDYDAQRGTDLTGTLTAFFQHGQNSTRTAEALYVHPNTVGQRLERVARLLGTEWRNPERSLEIHLALQLQRLAASGSF